MILGGKAKFAGFQGLFSCLHKKRKNQLPCFAGSSSGPTIQSGARTLR